MESSGVILVVGLIGFVILNGAGLLIAYWFGARRLRRAYLDRVRGWWQRDGRTIQYGPVATTCYGFRPASNYEWGVLGALGLADDHLIFSGYNYNLWNADIPLAAVRWLGVRNTAERTLIVHCDVPGTRVQDSWRVYVFALDDLDPLPTRLSDFTGLSLHDLGTAYHEIPPVIAARLRQDIYGQWHPDRKVMLYLAPDRLLSDWRAPILLADMRGVAVVARTGLNLMHLALLRIEYEYATVAGPPQTVGFEMPFSWAEELGRALAERADVPLAVDAGRKKKEA